MIDYYGFQYCLISIICKDKQETSLIFSNNFKYFKNVILSSNFISGCPVEYTLHFTTVSQLKGNVKSLHNLPNTKCFTFLLSPKSILFN